MFKPDHIGPPDAPRVEAWPYGHRMPALCGETIGSGDGPYWVRFERGASHIRRVDDFDMPMCPNCAARFKRIMGDIGRSFSV